MRQAGVLAAAGIVALEQMVDRLVEDHEHAQKLAKKLLGIPGIVLNHGLPTTNMIFIGLDERVRFNTHQIGEMLAEKGLLVGMVSPREFRLVTHYWIREESIDRAASVFRDIISSLS